MSSFADFRYVSASIVLYGGNVPDAIGDGETLLDGSCEL